MAQKAGNVANGRRKGNPIIKARRARSIAKLPLKKLKRVLHASGVEYAVVWAKEHGVASKLTPEMKQKREARHQRTTEKHKLKAEMRHQGF